MLKLNKEDVTSTMVENNPSLSKVKAQEQLDESIIAIIETLAKGKDEPADKKGIRAKLTMVGFGSLLLRANPRRKHRNPQTNAEVYKEAHNSIKLVEGKTFHDVTN